MKSPTQAIMLVVVLVVLVGGITFVRQWMIPATEDVQTGTTAPVPEGKLVFQNLDKATHTAEALPGECEHEHTGHSDFWFHNPHPQPVQLTLKQVNCVCSTCRVGTIDPADWNEQQRLAAGLAVFPALLAPAGSPCLIDLATLAFLEKKPHWRGVDEGQSVSIPAADPQDGPSWGVVRVTWNGKKEGPQRLAVNLEDETNYPYRLEAPVTFLAPLFVHPKVLALADELVSGSQDSQSVDLLCWSSTRPRFELKAREKNDDPCFVCTVQPAAFDELAKEIMKAEGYPLVLSGYRVKVQVYERRDGRQLDLGPFRRTIELQMNDDPKPYAVPISGKVRGEVGIVSGERVPLGTFPASAGSIRKTVELESIQPGLKLSVADRVPDYLEAKLGEPRPTKDGRTAWDLTVKVPPNRPDGPLAADAAVILKIDGTPPRRIRIPVTGNALMR